MLSRLEAIGGVETEDEGRRRWRALAGGGNLVRGDGKDVQVVGEDGDDSDVEVTSTQVSLACPISLQRISVPVRGPGNNTLPTRNLMRFDIACTVCRLSSSLNTNGTHVRVSQAIYLRAFLCITPSCQIASTSSASTSSPTSTLPRTHL